MTATVRVFHRPEGWTLLGPPSPEPCLSNFRHEEDGRLPCTNTAVWKVVEVNGLVASIAVYCDTDLPAKYRRLARLLAALRAA